MSNFFVSPLKLRKYCRKVLSLRETAEDQKIIINTGWQVLEKISRLCCALISSAMLARYLQPESYGIYSYALAFTSFFVAISSLGTSQILVRDLVKESENREEIISSVAVLRVFSGTLLAAIASCIAINLVEDRVTQLLVIIFSLQMIPRASEVLECSFQSSMENRYTAYSRVLASSSAAALTAAAILSQQSIFVLAAIAVYEYLASLLFLLKFYARKGYTLSLSLFSSLRTKKIIAESWPLALSSCAIVVYMRVDQIMIAHLSDSKELGLYSAAVQITEAFYLVPMAFISSSFPSIVEFRKESEHKFYAALQNLYNKVSLISYASILFTSFFSKQLLASLYGNSYIAASSTLSLLIWSVIFVALGVARSTVIITMNWTHIHLKTVIIASLFNIALNYFLIPRYGAFGAAISTVASYCIASNIACFFFRPLYRTGIMLTKALLLIR